ncbi:MAG: hypothetical protein WBA54_07410 [Acidaminobacteraceae bacterium]
MKKLTIALILFSIAFTACTVSSLSSGATDLNVSIDKVDKTVDEEVTNIDSISLDVVSSEISDGSKKLVGEFDILVDLDYDFSKLTYKSAETTKNILIENIVKDIFFSEKENPEYSYTYNYINLNDDEFDDMIVLLGGMEFAGSGGSTVLILKGEEDKSYSLINKVTLARTPIVVTNTSSNGYRDLMFVVYGGGSETLHNILKYDGVKYPLNPSMQLEAELGRVFEGEALIANTAFYNNLIQADAVQ